jgi:hypothetical protein
MNTENEKRLDDLFKKKLEDPVDEIRYEEGDWDALEQMLDKPKRRGIIYWLPVLSGVAALMLLFFGWWMFKDKGVTHSTKNQQQVVAGHKKPDTIVEHTQIAAQKRKDTIVEQKAQQLQAAAQQKKVDTIVEHKALKQTGAPVQKAVRPFNDDGSLLARSANKAQKDTIVERGTVKNNRIADKLVAINQAPVIKGGAAGAQPVKQADLPRPVSRSVPALAANTNNNSRAKTKLAYRPQYTLSVIAAPDLNGVSSFQQSKVGTNIGLGFTVGLSKKLTVSTGALYSVKPYATNFDNYHTAYQWKVTPTNVTADCRMLDIPLNVNYQVYHKAQNKLSFGTGLSSYIMLHESYKFSYADSYGSTTSPANYTVPSPGKYFFGVVNLNATYERQLNSKVGLSIQPYMKLPLTNIGYSQVKLQTTGVAIGLSWNLNSLRKP